MRTAQNNRIRRSTKYVCYLLAIVLIITSLCNLGQNLSKENMQTSTKEIYNYTNKFDYSYQVNLIDNPYIKEDVIQDKTIAYVTDLIDNTDFTLNYEYVANKQADLEYSYSIVGKMQVVYTKDGEEQKIWDEEETLLEEKKLEAYSDKININEKLKVDLKSKNELLNDFKQKMGMSIDAIYTIKLKILVSTNVEDEPITVTYAPTVQVDLAEKTSKITGENNKEDSEYISKEYEVKGSTNVVMIIVDIILIGISILLIKYVTKARTTNIVKNEFRQELNRVLKLCQDKIVEVSNKPNEEEENVVFVKDFGEIVKVSEELFKPILYYFDKENEEAWFSVMSREIVYRYIFRK